MNTVKNAFNASKEYFLTFLKWLLLASVTGAFGGVVGSAFHISVEHAAGLRETYHWLLWLLPVAGAATIGIYHIFRLNDNIGTNDIIESVRTSKKPPLLLAPAIFLGTTLTHLCGASSGREGAALQIGGTIGTLLGRIFHLNDDDMHIIIMCGMSSLFTALFGTPLTAVIFVMEVISVGVFYHAALTPCLIASLTAYGISHLFGISPIRFTLASIPELSTLSVGKVALLAILCALLSILFCSALHHSHKLLAKLFNNSYIRIAVCGTFIILLTYLTGTHAYNGAGMNIVEDALFRSVPPGAFILKIIFTAISIGGGYKGGEIVPAFFVGATFGYTVGTLLGLPPGFAAAIGMVALFCGMVNCPIASIFLSVELFGASGLLFFWIACSISYMFSGYHSLYSSQKILFSKLRPKSMDLRIK